MRLTLFGRRQLTMTTSTGLDLAVRVTGDPPGASAGGCAAGSEPALPAPRMVVNRHSERVQVADRPALLPYGFREQDVIRRFDQSAIRPIETIQGALARQPE